MKILNLFRRQDSSDSDDHSPRYVDMNDIFQVMGEVYTEARLDAEMELAQDDVGFIKINSTIDSVMSESKRIDIVKLARLRRYTDPIASQSVSLYTGFGVGTGIQFTSRDEDILELINQMWNHRLNRKITSSKGQRDLSDRFLVDGELFFALFVGVDRVVNIRVIDPLEIEDIATDPDDRSEERFYVRKIKPRGPGSQERKIIYRDWMNTENRPGELKDGKLITSANPKTPVIFHINFQGTGIRGLSLLTAQLKWITNHRSFMNSRIAIQQSLARIARQFSVKGGMKSIEAIKNKLQSTRAKSSTDGEKNPAPAYGSSEVMPKSVDAKNLKQETGAQAAQIDGSMLMAMCGASVGIFPHYYGLGESFRLATASAMETPMLKTFESYSRIWIDIWSMIFDFQLEQFSKQDTESSIEITTPKVFPDDTKTVAESIKLIIESFPDFAESPDVQKIALTTLGLTDVDFVIEELDKIIAEMPDDEEDVPLKKDDPDVKPQKKKESIRSMRSKRKTALEVRELLVNAAGIKED